MQRSKVEKHNTLEELKKEFQHKMEVINEIKREKELREQQAQQKTDKEKRKRAEENKH